MITAAVIQTSIDEIKEITKIDLCVMNRMGLVVATTSTEIEVAANLIVSFVESEADSQTIAGNHFAKVLEGNEVQYVLIAKGEYEKIFMIAKIAVSQLKNLMIAYKEKFDKNIFFQNLILDNLLLVDIYNRAKKLEIVAELPRLVFLIETKEMIGQDAREMLASLYSVEMGDYITAVDEKNIILIKALESATDYTEADEIANTIVDMMNTEAMLAVRVSYGTIITELQEVSKSYKEAKMALDVSKIFYASKMVSAYHTLGIGRLIYQLPINLCKMFIYEVFGDKLTNEIDEEMLITVERFFENSLNVSGTSKQLFIHRNTLVYRIERLEKATGLDIRVFEDALTLKIALMVLSYMKYLDSIK